MSINVAIVFAKKEKTDFDRYTFPLLERPVAYYPIHAALYTSLIDSVFLSTDSPKLLLYGSTIGGLNILSREYSQDTLTEEIKKNLSLVVENTEQELNTVTILFANSPCITNDLIFNAISFLDENIQYDSVVTGMRRGEFSPARMYSHKNGRFEQDKGLLNYSDNVYFLDHRLMVTRPRNILNNDIKSNYVESILGENIHPVIQQEGIWDIDYPWQIPQVERWLRQNQFTETKSIYKKNIILSSGDVKRKKIKSDDYKKLLITTVPFGEIDRQPLELLDSNKNIEYVINPLNRKLKENELKEIIADYDMIIAGTEPITKKVLNNADKLKIISRVGIGLDSVDLNTAREKGITVCYTPDAPAPAVAELTIGLMLNLLRHISSVDRKMRAGIWNRIQGKRLSNMTIGIIGTGRVGSKVLKHIQGFNPRNILVNDILPKKDMYKIYNAHLVEKNEIYSMSDIITIHVPLTNLTRNMITSEQIEMMKPSALLINTSRGGIINEDDIFDALTGKKIAGAAIDTFVNEPYAGKLIELENCYFTCHMGSMTEDCRARMEIEATEEIIRFVNGDKLISIVPEDEYTNQLKVIYG